MAGLGDANAQSGLRGAVRRGDGGDALFLEHLAVINQVIAFYCRHYHLNAADADDFASHTRVKLLENDCAVLRKFQGRSSIKTFLSVTVRRIFLDFRIAAWGKWRPSAEARRAGPAAMRLEQLIERDGYTADEAFEILTTNHGMAISRSEVDRLAARFPRRDVRRFEREDALTEVPAPLGSDDDVLRAERVREQQRVAAALEIALGTMPAQDRLVLRLRFEEGRTVAEIAALLRLDQKALYRRLDRLFISLRRELERHGLRAQDVIALTADWPDRDEAPEIAAARPSIGKGVDAWP
jgi:RNA polymerase sigma factor for flagellar operon FliA